MFWTDVEMWGTFFIYKNIAAFTPTDGETRRILGWPNFLDFPKKNCIEKSKVLYILADHFDMEALWMERWRTDCLSYV